MLTLCHYLFLNDLIVIVEKYKSDCYFERLDLAILASYQGLPF
jgi:hypothetical protein